MINILVFININYGGFIINGGHIGGLGVDKCMSLFFTAATDVMSFAKLFCNCLMITLTSLINCWCSGVLFVISDCSFNMYESMLSIVGFSLNLCLLRYTSKIFSNSLI